MLIENPAAFDTSQATLTSGTTSSTPLYDFRLNPPYLVDFASTCSGKHVSLAKHRIRFKFGFSNSAAISDGATGVECRGREHEVTLVWSHTSGKILLLADGKEAHYSVGRPTRSKFQFSWTMRGNHMLTIVAHAAPALKSKPGWRQFDLLLDGLSVFDMPRIYELGVDAGGDAPMVPFKTNGQVHVYRNYTLPSADDLAWARSVQAHEIRRDMGPANDPVEETDFQTGQITPSPELKQSTENIAPNGSASSQNSSVDLLLDSTPAVQDHFGQPVALLDQALNEPQRHEHLTGNVSASMPITANCMANGPSFHQLSYGQQSSTASISTIEPFAAFSNSAPPEPSMFSPSSTGSHENGPHFFPTPVQPTQEQSSADRAPFERQSGLASSPHSLSPSGIGRTSPTPSRIHGGGDRDFGSVSPRGVTDVIRAEDVDGLGGKLWGSVHLDGTKDRPTERRAAGPIPSGNPFDETTGRSGGLPPAGASGWATAGMSLSEIKAAREGEGGGAPKREIMKTWNVPESCAA